MSKATIIMNSKSEWNNSRIPRIIIESGEVQTADQESGLGSKVLEKGMEKERRRNNPIKKYIAVKREKDRESQQPRKRMKEDGRGEERRGEEEGENDRGDHSIKRGGRETKGEMYRKIARRVGEAEKIRKRQNRKSENARRKVREVENKKVEGKKAEITEKEKVRKEYWRNVFSTMAERNRQKNGSNIVIGAKEHIERIRKSRTEKLTEQESTNRKEGSTRPPPTGSTREEKVTPTIELDSNPTKISGEGVRVSNRQDQDIGIYVEDSACAKEDSDGPPFKENTHPLEKIQEKNPTNREREVAPSGGATKNIVVPTEASIGDKIGESKGRGEGGEEGDEIVQPEGKKKLQDEGV